MIILTKAMTVMGAEESPRVNLAWLGYLNLPKASLKAGERVTPSSPLKWNEWKDDEVEPISWIPRHEGYVDVYGRSLKVLPQGPDPKTLPRRMRHQLNP